MYEEIINLLNLKGIKYEQGLNINELNEIEKLYEIEFPKSIRDFLMQVLPTEKGFYNWRDTSEENINFIKEAIKRPLLDVKEMAEEVYWCDDWGEEPDSEEEIGKEVINRLAKAPKLIPIFAHRYIPMISDDNPPIFSIHDIDIIYYGENLTEYFKVEFGEKKQDEIKFESINEIPFWSDIM